MPVPPAGAPEKPYVLVVDDEPLIADTLAAILSHNGYQAAVACSSAQAIERVHRHRPEVLITDFQMPDADGIELALTIRDIMPACRILVFSGHATPDELIFRMRQRGCSFEILTKPLPPGELLERLADGKQAEVIPFEAEQRRRVRR